MANTMVQFKLVDKNIWNAEKADASTFYRVVNTDGSFELYLGKKLLSNQDELNEAIAKLNQDISDLEAHVNYGDLGVDDEHKPLTVKDYVHKYVDDEIAKVDAGTLRDEIAAITDPESGILKQAKDYTDQEVLELSNQVGNLSMDLGNTNSTVQGMLDSATGVVAQAVSAANLYTDGITAPIIQDVGDLKATVGDSASGLVHTVTTLEAVVGDENEGLVKDVAGLEATVTTLVGEDSGKSIRTIANEELAAQLIAEDATESLDTLKEIAEWIQSHPEDAAAMNAEIAKIKSGEVVVAKATDADKLDGKDSEYFAVKETVNAALDNKANVADVYTKEEANALLNNKADKTSVYTKDEADGLLANKANSADVYTKEAANALLNNKANSADVYTKDAADQKFVETVELVSGTTQGTIKVAVDGVAGAEVAVAGLGSAAFTDSDAYATAAQGTKADSALQASDIAEGTEAGMISVKGTDVKVHRLGTAAFVNTEAFDTNGAAAAVLGTAEDKADAATVYGAKAYAKDIAIDASGSALNLAKADTAAQIATALAWTTLSSME